jgi:hypothetical protein
MPRLDRETARAMTEAGYMPLSEYIEMYEPHLRLQHVESPSTAPKDDWAKLERLLISTTFDLKD